MTDMTHEKLIIRWEGSEPVVVDVQPHRTLYPEFFTDPVRALEEVATEVLGDGNCAALAVAALMEIYRLKMEIVEALRAGHKAGYTEGQKHPVVRIDEDGQAIQPSAPG